MMFLGVSFVLIADKSITDLFGMLQLNYIHSFIDQFVHLSHKIKEIGKKYIKLAW